MSVPKAKTHAIGIDLGTTNTVECIFNLEDGSSSTITNNEGIELTPSLIGFSRNGVVVGHAALECSPENTVRDVKKSIGQPYSKIEKIAKSFEFKIIEEGKMVFNFSRVNSL